MGLGHGKSGWRRLTGWRCLSTSSSGVDAARIAIVTGSVILLSTLAGASAIANPAPAVGGELHYDLDADGTVDLVVAVDESPAAPAPHSTAGLPPGRLADRNDDGRLETADSPAPRHAPAVRTAGHPSADPPVPLADEPDELPEITFQEVWDSGGVLSNVLCVEAGDADLDGIFDFAGTHFSPNIIHLFESWNGNDYVEIWNSTGNSPPGSYRDLVFADTDGDGLGEILGGEVSTLGKVMLFEQSGDGFAFLHDTIRETDLSGALRLRSVLVGDTDRDGRQEVIVATGGSSPTGGLVSIWEHNGVVGDNTYIRVYEYTTVSYLFQAALGDSDNDDWPEIVLGLGGFGGNPLIIRRLEYDEGTGTWVHQQFTSSVIGLPTTPHVADLDDDGDFELAYGSGSGDGFVVVFENTGENTYEPDFVSNQALGGNVLSLASFPMSVPDAPALAAGSFEGDVGLWSWDADAQTYQQNASLMALGGAVRQLALDDDGDDGFEELLPAIAPSVDQVRVYRREDTVGVPDLLPAPARVPSLVAAPNPFRAWTRIVADPSAAFLTIHDVQGRIVRRITVTGGRAQWDARDARGREVTAGVYWVRLEQGDEPAHRLVVVR